MATVFEELSLKGLRLAHLRQVQEYIMNRDRDGWCYGNREQVEQRHDDLSNWIDRAVEYAESEGVKMPKEVKIWK